MKTIKFNLCKYTITITIAKKKYKAPAPVVEQGQYTSTVNEPISCYVPDELVEEYKSAPGLSEVKEGIRPISEAFKMEDKTDADDDRPMIFDEGDDFEQPELVYDWFHAYVRDMDISGNYATSTIRGYQNIYMRHLSIMMLMPTSYLTEGLIQSAFDEEIKRGLSEKTLKGYRNLVNRVLAKYAPDFHPEIRIEKEAADENT